MTSTSINEALDGFSYHNLIGRKLENSIPDLNGMTTATIERYIPWLGMNHAIASNTSLKDRSPYYREYSKVFYGSQKPGVQEIDLGYYDPELEGRYFYRMTHLYYEDIYTSTYPFYQWEFERIQYMYEVFKSKEVSTSLNWNRQSQETDEGYTQYEDIEDLSFSIEMNSAIGVNISSDTPFSVHLGDLLIHSHNNSLDIPIVSEPNLSIDIDIDKISNQNGVMNIQPKPTYLKIDLRGGHIVQRAYHPMGEIEEEETTYIHKPSTPLDKRLLPPNKKKGDPDFPTEFWNYNGPQPEPTSRAIASLSEAPKLWKN